MVQFSGQYESETEVATGDEGEGVGRRRGFEVV